MGISVVDISNSLWINELEQSTLASIPEISFWVRSSGIGSLNSLIYTSYTINQNTLELSPDSFGVDELSILGQIYLLKFFQSRANSFLGAVGINGIIEYSENGHTIRKLNRGTLAQTFLNLKAQVKVYLDELLGLYKINRATPRDISGIDACLLIRNIPRYNRHLYGGF